MKKEIKYSYAGYEINITIESDEEEIINAFIDKCFVKSEYYQYDSKIDRGLNKPISNDELKDFFKWANDNGYGSNWFGWYKIDEVPSISVAMNYGVGLTYITSEDIILKFRESKIT